MSLLQRVLGRIVDVRREETVTMLLMFAYSFLAMTAYNIIKPLTRSKLIAEPRRRRTALRPASAPASLIGILMIGLHPAHGVAPAPVGAPDHPGRHGGRDARLLGALPERR